MSRPREYWTVEKINETLYDLINELRRVPTSKELILEVIRYQKEKGSMDRPAVFMNQDNADFKAKHGVSTKQIYRSLNK